MVGQITVRYLREDDSPLSTDAIIAGKQLNTPMKKKLLHSALISTPILALYIISPLYILKVFIFPEHLENLAGLFLNILLVWLINIKLCLRYRQVASWRRALISYGVNFVFQIYFVFISAYFQDSPPFADQQFLLYPLLTSIAFNAIILLLCNSILVADNKASADVEIQKLKFQNSEAQKQILQQQLHPHFLFNALSVLKSLTRESPSEAGLYAVKLSDFLRYSVTAPSEVIVSLGRELEFTLGYIELQKARFQDSFTCAIDIPAHACDLKIPVYALQTLVENAFKHNYFTQKRPMHLSICCQDQRIQVSNNKVSLRLTERSGTGLRNLGERYRMITGNEILVEESESTFSVTLQLLSA